MYCIEAVDHGGGTRGIVLPRDAELRADYRPDLLDGVTVVMGGARRLLPDGAEENVGSFAVPYAVWGNREVGEMDVWLREMHETTLRE